MSQQIYRLEEDLGVLLFDRSGYRPVLTRAGAHYSRECKSLVDAYADALASTRAVAAQHPEPVLKVGITGHFEGDHLPALVQRYQSRCPDVVLDIKKTNFATGAARLLDGSLDVAFGLANDFRDQRAIASVVLFPHRVCVVCAHSHPWAHRSSVAGRELDQQPIVTLSEAVGRHFYTDFMESFQQDGVTPRIVKKVDDLEELLLAVRLNQGIALTSREVIRPEDDVAVLDIVDTHHHAEFCLGYLAANPKGFLAAFVEETSAFYSALHKPS